MAEALSQAERWRAHREAFAYALEHGCTPKEAADRIAIEKAKAAHSEASARLAAKIAGHPLPRAESVTPEQAFANTERLLGEHD